MWNFLLFLGMGIIRVLFEEFRSIRSRIRKRRRRAQHWEADRINSSRGIGRGWKRGKALKIETTALLICYVWRASARKSICNRSTASLLYACHANAYARHVRFPGVTAPSLVVIRVPRLLPALVRPINAKKRKNTYRLPIEPLNRWYHDHIRRAWSLYVSRSRVLYLQLYWNNFASNGVERHRTLSIVVAWAKC